MLTRWSDAVRPTLTRFTARYRAAEGPRPWTIALAFLMLLFSWNIPVLNPSEPGGDRDYFYLIQLALDRGMDFGSQISTTYGPLFFLTAPDIARPAHVVAAYLSWIVLAGLALTALLGVRTSWLRWVLAVVLTLSMAATPLSSVITTGPLLLILLAASDGNRLLPVWMERIFPFFAAVFVSMLALNKFSTAGIAGAFVVAALISRRRWIGLIQFVATGLIVATSIWLIVGQPLLSLPVYVSRALAVGAGQSGAMGLELPGGAWEYPFAAMGGIVILAFIALARPRVHIAKQIAWIILVAASCDLMFKQGFVRHDSHSAQFFALIATLAIFLGLLRRSRVMALIAVLAVVVQVSVFGQTLASVDPTQRVARFGTGLANTFDPSLRKAQLTGARDFIRKDLRVPDNILQSIGSGSVYTEPFNASIGYGYRLNDAILPTLLEYGAYNSTLDQVNSEWFDDPASAPEFILRRKSAFTLDGRNPLWDSPRAKVSEICWYEPTINSDEWLLLKRRTASACGAPTLRSRLSVGKGESAQITPEGNTLTVISLAPAQSAMQKIAAVVYKPRDLLVTLDGTRYRLPWGHTNAPLAASGYNYDSGGVQGGAFTVAVNADTAITVTSIPFSAR